MMRLVRHMFILASDGFKEYKVITSAYLSHYMKAFAF